MQPSFTGVFLVTGLVSLASVHTLQRPALTADQIAVLRYMHVEHMSDGAGGTIPTIVVEGVNLQLVNGLGATNGNPSDPSSTDPGDTATNGVGNLILGYNEEPLSKPNRAGSHNLVLGIEHGYESFGGLVGGSQNKSSGPYSAIMGGRLNRVSAAHGASLGGSNNEVLGRYATAVAGAFNHCTGEGASVGGGFRGSSSGDFAVVNGGYKNLASGVGSTVNGGGLCNADGLRSAVCGGWQRSVSGDTDWRAGELFEDD